LRHGWGDLILCEPPPTFPNAISRASFWSAVACYRLGWAKLASPLALKASITEGYHSTADKIRFLYLFPGDIAAARRNRPQNTATMPMEFGQ
jgi:hypothetical protein